MTSSIEPTEGCIAYAVQILGDKWTPFLLRELADGGNVRFSVLQQRAGGVNPRTLSERLVRLEEEGIITKQIFAEVPPHVEYALTAKGQDLLPVLKSMAVWGDKHQPAKIG